MPEHRSGRSCSRNRSVVAPAGVPEHQSKRGYPRNRSAVALTGRPLIHFSVLGSHIIICISELITYLILSCTFIYILILFIYGTFVCFHLILFMYYIFLCFPYTILFIYLSLLSTFYTLLVHILFVYYTLFFLYIVFM